MNFSQNSFPQKIPLTRKEKCPSKGMIFWNLSHLLSIPLSGLSILPTAQVLNMYLRPIFFLISTKVLFVALYIHCLLIVMLIVRRSHPIVILGLGQYCNNITPLAEALWQHHGALWRHNVWPLGGIFSSVPLPSY